MRSFLRMKAISNIQIVQSNSKENITRKSIYISAKIWSTHKRATHHQYFMFQLQIGSTILVGSLTHNPCDER